MNFLAHAYLSFGQEEILIGNMISDFVKGKKRYDYPLGIQQGISIHREIDRYTDRHAAVKSIKEIFRPVYRLYSGAIADVVMDHFLATDENEFDNRRLMSFTQNTYSILDRYTHFFPEKFGNMYPYMKMQNWLYNYQFEMGIEKSLGGLVRRSMYMKESESAFHLFNEHYDELKGCYNIFFPDLKNQITTFYQSISVS